MNRKLIFNKASVQTPAYSPEHDTFYSSWQKSCLLRFPWDPDQLGGIKKIFFKYFDFL